MAGKRIIVTGAANGIGAHIVHYLARNLSARISVIDRDSTALKLFEQRLLKDSGPSLKSEDLLFIECDVSSEHSVKSAVAKTISTFGGIDGLVNNAGISTPYGFGKKTRLEDWSTEEFDGYLKTNLTGAFMFCRECAGELEKTKGSIVNIASSRAAQSEPLSEGYAASKGGLVSLTHALAASLGPRGIRVNAISPGWIDVRDAKQSEVSSFPPSPSSIEPLTAEDHSQHWVGRVGQGQDIASLAAFLLDGKQSGFVTGQNWQVDGGMGKKMIYVE